MKTNNTLTKVFFGIAFVFSLFLFFKPTEVQASHFKGGQLSWVPTGGNTVQFTLVSAFTRTGFAGSDGDGYPAVGDVITETIGGTTLNFGDATATPILQYKVVSINVSLNFLLAEALEPGDSSKTTIDHTYPSPDNGGAPWFATAASCCRSSSELNNPDGNYAISTYVELVSGNTSPFSALIYAGPILLPQDTGSSFVFTATDPDANSTLRFRLATGAEAGLGFTQPVGLAIDNVTGLVTWDTYSMLTGYYSAQVIVEDSDVVAGTLLTSVAVDLIIYVECTNLNDDDGDGVAVCGGDCDDTDASIYPGASEVCADGIDQDCSGFDGVCNDSCHNAVEIFCGDSLDGTTLGATVDSVGSCGASIHAGVWYKWTGNGDSATFTTCAGITGFYDTQLSIFSGSCDTLDCIVFDDDAGCGFTSSASIYSVPGTDYYILVHGFGGSLGDFTLALNCKKVHVPEFIAPSPECGDTIWAGAGIGFNVAFTVTASDSDALETVTLDATGVPAGATLNPALPTLGNPVSADFSWTPLMADVGTHVVTFSATDDGGHTTTCSYTIIVYACKASVNAGLDANSYYGYPPQQTITRTALATGGPNGDYTYEWSLNRNLICDSITASGDESFTGGTCTNGTCPVAGTPSCEGSATVSVTLLAPGTVCVTVTDAGGCSASDCFVINAIDVRCFAGNSGPKKVLVCHQTGSTTQPWVQICIDKKAVRAHLREHSVDYLGTCTGGAKWDGEPMDNMVESKGEFIMSVYPNPAETLLNIEFETPEQADYQLALFDNLGRKVLGREGVAFADGNRLLLPLDDVAPGIYYLNLNVGDRLSSVKIAVTK